MDIKTLNEITRILTKHSSEDDSLSIAHDDYGIYLGGPDVGGLDEEVVRKLEKLGCKWDNAEDCWYVLT